jgi:MFS family permease
VLQFLMGLCNALAGMAIARLVMAIVPPMGRNHFFALYSVLGSLALGLAPILWGLTIDAVGTRHFGERFDWNRYSIFFGAAAAAFGVTLALVRRIEEPKAASMDALLRELLVQTPQRAWARLWTRE